ncbi:hypothetical protein RI138_14675 [Streptomyces sp. C11-1]|uniref:Lipoprotein n=1 Tax=Streptomyces durocortorensis TaxID=2811104 RepID=A0ABY9VZ92_9ACTN|nr:hypothetical protein [Streptomyces durocortorensis]WNF27970.1 hypothetical protein RI138_14675 [Streptomyces durocortorensis]
MRRTRALIVGTVGVALLAASGTACGPEAGTQGKAAASTTSAPSPTATATASASATATASASATSATRSPSGSPTPTPTASTTTRPAPRTPAPPSKSPTRPPVPTYLAMHAAAPGGRIALEPGGNPREFTVTLHNGNTRAYRHLVLAFQLEGMPGTTANPAYTLERWDAAAGTWRAATLRIANDVFPYTLYTGGTPLAKDAASTHRYRVRALTGAPAGPNPILISLIDTDADTRVYSTSLSHTTLD